ncbi:hypothetical protein CQ056_05430 [Peribacillus simplex]|nr:hypothetical protein CQ056_05430 [Peribacillus simplex]
MADSRRKGNGFLESTEMRFQKNSRLDTPEPSLRRGDPRVFFTVTLKGWKKFATLLLSNWLAETPETFTSRRLGRQSVERERISGNDWNVI